MWIKIVPNDTLFFRSGRPFSLGSETWADGIFPPYPSTIYGALRTFFLFHRGTLKFFNEVGYDDIGSPCRKGKMKIVGPVLIDNDGYPLFRCPFDLVKVKGSRESKIILLKRIKKPKIYFSDDNIEEILLHKGMDTVKESKEYLDDITLIEYLKGIKKEFQFRSEERLYTLENKIGIARDRATLASKDGHLYRIPMIRLKECSGFIVKIDGVSEIPERGVFQLGAEGKTVKYETISENPLKELENINFELQDGIFKLYFATPAIFKKGWIPEWIDENSLKGEKEGIKIQLIACAIGKYVRIGGWDMAKRRPKRMYKAIPAGSVYYFRVLCNAKLEKIKEVFHMKNISDIMVDEGYGLSFVGGVV